MPSRLLQESAGRPSAEFMRERPSNLPYVYLRPGDVHFSKVPMVVGTVLGSCLAVTLFSRQLAVGAICHALLPYGEGRGGLKYLDCAVDHMLKEFSHLRVRPHELDAKLFGGADMFGPSGLAPGRLTIGRQNIGAAQAILNHKGVAVSNTHLGGELGRKIYFLTHTGEVLLKRVARTLPPAGVR